MLNFILFFSRVSVRSEERLEANGGVCRLNTFPHTNNVSDEFKKHQDKTIENRFNERINI